MLRSSVVALGATIALTISPGAVVAGPSTTEQPAASSAERKPSPKVRVLQPDGLERGRDARLPHLQDGVIRRPGAKALRVKVPHHLDRQVLLGASGKDWLVASEKGRVQRVHRIRRGRANVAVSRFRGSRERHREWVGYRLSREGDQLARLANHPYTSSLRIIDALTGDKVVGRTQEEFDDVLDFSGGHVWANGFDSDRDNYRLFDWEPDAGTPPASVSRAALAVFPDRDLVFVNTKGLRYGPTSLSSPTKPAWSARFGALDVSPDGSWVIGALLPRGQSRAHRVLQVRRMSNGRVLQQFRFGRRLTPTHSGWMAFEQTARFETNKRFVFQVEAGARNVLVRCTRAGKCVRASRTGGDISFPYERYAW